jgi:hypothetical protein
VDLVAQFELITADITGDEYGKALTDAAPVLTTIGGFVTGIGFAPGPMTAEQHTAGKVALDACVAACDAAEKKCKGTPTEVGKIGDGTILAALSKLLALALQFWPLIAPFIKP